MKVKIKRKILEESKLDHKFPTTAQYRQTQPVQSDKAFNHAGEDIQFSRIEIGKNIDRFLQRPFVTVGDEFDEPDGSITKITNPKETNLLFYVYKGIDDNGALMDKYDVSAVNSELNQRVEHFITSLEGIDVEVLSSDIDNIIEYLTKDKSPESSPSHQSTRMLKGAPGHFDAYVFAARSRSIYKDTRAGKDFMLKSTPELKNIPDEHHFLFSMSNLMKRVKQALNAQPSTLIPPLDYETYDANYKLGTTTETIEGDKQPPSESDKAYYKGVNDFFVIFYKDPKNYEDLSDEKQFELMSEWFESLLYKIKDKLEDGKIPEEFMALEEISHNVPHIFFDTYGEAIESYIEAIEEISEE
jgi:hypothetical protein|tara:strand:- start:3012 stop:4082 length:1071 start_codon:yes stop_codon:yes gene_type:complete